MTSHSMRCTVDIIQLPERTEKATYLLRAEIVVFKTLPIQVTLE
jgi:hypothetical protein